MIAELTAEMDDEDENPTLEAYFINSFMFDVIKAVPEVLQARKVAELPMDDDMGEDHEEDDAA